MTFEIANRETTLTNDDHFDDTARCRIFSHHLSSLDKQDLNKFLLGGFHSQKLTLFSPWNRPHLFSGRPNVCWLQKTKSKTKHDMYRVVRSHTTSPIFTNSMNYVFQLTSQQKPSPFLPIFPPGSCAATLSRCHFWHQISRTLGTGQWNPETHPTVDLSRDLSHETSLWVPSLKLT